MSNPVQILMVVDAKCCENEKKKILFSCMKLLTHFSGQLDKNALQVKWGHNFYNCPRAIIAKHRRKSFTDFTEDSFKEFESDIGSVSELISNQINYSMNSFQLPTAKIIERALTEALYDYPWVKPDLSSPEARNKYKLNASAGEPQERASQNLMFLIAACPNSSQQLCEFFGDKNFTGLSFVNPSLQQLFVENDNVRLLWMDIGTRVLNAANDITLEQDKLSCMITIRNELRKTNGDLIPSRIFLQLDTRLCVPLSSLVSYYLDMDARKDACVSARILFPHESTYEACKLELCALTKNKHRSMCATQPKTASSLSLVPIGTINETEICPQSFKVCNEFVCFYKSDTLIDYNVERKIENFMVALKARNLAMVVSCDHGNLGIILPFVETKMGLCGLLYILDAIECNISSTNLEKLPFKSKDVLNNTSDKFSADTSESWFIPESFPADVKSLLDSNVDTTKTCHLINGQLRKFYLSSVEKKKPQIDTVSQIQKSSPKVTDDVGNFSFSDRSAKIMAKSKIKAALETNQKKLLNVTEKFSHMEQLKSKQEDLQTTFTRLMADQAAVLDEIQLKTRVMDLYGETVAGQLNILDGAKSIVHLMYNFAKATSENPKDFMEKMRHECLRKCDLRPSNTNATKSSEVQMCMINVLWELEAHLVSINDQDTNDISDKVTAQLRLIPIHSDIATLSTFLQDVIFENYYPILENVLSNVCEELNFPMPIDGATCASPAASSLIGDITDNESRSPSSISVASNPRSNSNLLACHQEKRTRVVGKHPSFADLMQVRQISLPKKEVVKKQVTNSTEADNSKGRRSARKARRNLFDSKPKDNPSSPQSKSRDKCFTPNGTRVLKTKVVAETPERKQVSNVIRSRQACLRRLNMGDQTDVDIVHETPTKAYNASRSKLFYSSSQNNLHSTSLHTGQNVQHYLLSPTKLNESELSTQHRSTSILRGRYNHGLLKRKCDLSGINDVSPAAKTFVIDAHEEQLETCVPTTPEKPRPQNVDLPEERIISTPLRYGMESPTQHNFTLLDKLDCNYEESQCELSLSPSIPLVTGQNYDSPDESIHSSEDLNEAANGSDQVVDDDQNQERSLSAPAKNPGSSWSSPSVKSLLHLTSSPILTGKF